jgi:hypothetical protein
LDTREKIVPLSKLSSHLGDKKWLAVVGLFDPLTLAHANRLAEISRRGAPLLAVVEQGSETLLPADARAALVAALRCVKLVVMAEADSIPKHFPLELIRDEEGEQRRSREFVEWISERGAR